MSRGRNESTLALPLLTGRAEQWLVCNDELVEVPQKSKKRKVDVKSEQADQVTCDSVYMLVYKRDSEVAPIDPPRAILEKVEEDDQALDRELGERAVKSVTNDDFTTVS